MSWLSAYKEKITDAATALERSIKSGARLILNANCGEPQTLAAALADIAPSLRDVEVLQLLALGQAAYVRKDLYGHLRLNAFFIGPSIRNAVNEGDIGGQVDFVRGASRAKKGKAIIAFPATAKNGELSRIVPTLAPGAGVVTSRGDVHYVATEYGVVNLRGKSIRQRARALINIAHPKFRDDLEHFAYEQHFFKSRD